MDNDKITGKVAVVGSGNQGLSKAAMSALPWASAGAMVSHDKGGGITVEGLREHLQRSEIEYVATHGGGYPETFKWRPDIEAHLHDMGFRIKERQYDSISGYNWLVTTNNLYVCLHDGFVSKVEKPTRRKKGS